MVSNCASLSSFHEHFYRVEANDFFIYFLMCRVLEIKRADGLSFMFCVGRNKTESHSDARNSNFHVQRLTFFFKVEETITVLEQDCLNLCLS